MSLPNLLIVDDTKDNLFFLYSITRHLKINLIQALSGYEALEKTKNLEIALAILDVRMPGMNGYELAIKLNEGRSIGKVPVIFVTANKVTDLEVFQGYGSGAVDYIFKPIDNLILLSKINVFIDLHNQKHIIQNSTELLEKKSEELKKVISALRVSEEKYRSYIDHAPDGVFIADDQGRYIEVNESACEITGYSKSELLNMTVENILPEDSVTDGLSHFRKVIKTGSAKDELFFKHKDGTKRWWSIEAVKLSQNRILGFTKDITQRKIMEESIRIHHIELESQNDELSQAIIKAENASEKYEELFDFAPSGYFSLTSNSLILALNLSGAHLIELTRTDLTGRHFSSFVSPESLPVFQTFIQNIFKNQIKDVCELILQTDTKKTKYVHIEGRVVGNNQQCFLNVVDITERKLAEQALKESQEKYKTMLNASPDGILITNLKGIITDVSDIGIELFGADNRNDVIGEHFINFVPSEEKMTVRKVIEKTMIEGIAQSIEMKVKKKNQSLLLCEISSTLIQEQDGTPLSFMVILRDISQRKELEIKQIHADRMASLGEMASGIAHEINQPLNTMSLVMDNILCEVGQSDCIDKTYLKRKSEKIFENITRIRNIIDHVRAFSRNYDDYILTEFDINTSIIQAVSMISEQYKHLEISINLHLADNLPVIIGNTYRFEQVILNLLSNAKDALIEKKNKNTEPYDMIVDIKSLQENQRLIVTITDNGAGISEEDIKHIILPFYTTKDVGKGTGLGLSISYQIIKEMNGTIEIESKILKGTSFSIIIMITNN